MESFNGKLRDELLEREVFYSLREAQVLIERWREHYNKGRPHSALEYRPPAPETRKASGFAADHTRAFSAPEDTAARKPVSSDGGKLLVKLT